MEDQTQRNSVRKHVERRPKVPRYWGSERQFAVSFSLAPAKVSVNVMSSVRN